MEQNFFATEDKVALQLGTLCSFLRERIDVRMSDEYLKAKILDILDKQGFTVCSVDVRSLLEQILLGSFKRGASSLLSPQLFDCSGLVRYIYAAHGIMLPRRSVQILDAHNSVLHQDAELRFGDVLFFKGYHERKPHGESLPSVGHVAFTLDAQRLVQVTRKYGSKVHSIEEFILERQMVAAVRVTDFATLTVLRHPKELEIRETSDVFWIIHDVMAGWIKPFRKK